jgi:hypothetical protein
VTCVPMVYEKRSKSAPVSPAPLQSGIIQRCGSKACAPGTCTHGAGDKPLDATTRSAMESQSGHDFSRVSVHADVQQPDGDKTKTEDCPDDQAREINAAIAAASPAILSTISAILHQTPATTAALQTYFGTSGPSQAAHIALRLAVIERRLPGATVECEMPGSFLYNFFCGDALAYVRPIPAFFGLANIHVCQPQFSRLTEVQRVATVIHEGAHRYTDASDKAYYTLDCQQTPATAALSDYDRSVNADSYACLVQALH